MPPRVQTVEETGVAPIPTSDLDKRACVIGCASAGSSLPLEFGTPASIVTEYTSGPLARYGQDIVSRTRTALLLLRAATGTPGAYGTIDLSAFTGTAVPAARTSSVPVDEYDGYWKIVDGGTVGTDGVTYYQSDDDGRTLSGLLRLGTGTALEITNTGIVVDLDPPTAALAAFVDDLRLQTVDHFALTSGTVHGAADATSGAGIPGTTVSTLAQARTCMIALKAAALLHVVNTSSSIHGAADTAAQTALNAITISSSSTGQQVLTAALAYADAMFGDGSTDNDAHNLRIASSVHGAKDTTNLITATTPTRGTLVAGDIIRLPTTAPIPSESGLSDAFDALASSDQDCSIVLLTGRWTEDEADTMSAGLDTLEEAGKRVLLIVQGRERTDDETEAQFVAAVRDEWADVEDSRIAVCVGNGEEVVTFRLGSATRNYAGPFSPRVVARMIQQARNVPPGQISVGPLDGVSLTNSNSQLVGHDEQETPGLEDGRFICLYRPPVNSLRRGAYVSKDLVMRGPEERIYGTRVRRLTNIMERTVEAVLWNEIGKTFNVTLTTPTTGILAGADRDAITAKCAAPIRAGFQDDISDAGADDLVALDPNVTVDGDTFGFTGTLNYTPRLELTRATTRFSIRVGG